MAAARTSGRFEVNETQTRVRALYQTEAGPKATDWFPTEAEARAAIPKAEAQS